MGEKRFTAREALATPEPLASPEEVSAYLNDIPVKTLAKWRSEGTGPKYRKIGRHVRYDWADVREWVASQQPAPAIA